MPQTPTHIRKQALPAIRKQEQAARKQALPAVLVPIVVFACIGLSACGSSSSKDTTVAGVTSTAPTATTPTPSSPARESSSGRPRKQSRAPHFGTATFRHALAAFATCMRHNGVKLSVPDTSGTGPVFGTKGVNTASATFKAASAKCQSVLRSAFPRKARPGAPPRGAQ